MEATWAGACCEFDGTLAHGITGWTDVLLAAIEETWPGCAADQGRLRSALSVDFPGHSPEIGHPEL